MSSSYFGFIDSAADDQPGAGILGQLRDPKSVISGAVGTALITGLSLVDARTLTPRTRPLSRLASAATSAWWVWNTPPNEFRFPSINERLAYTAAAFGLSLGAAPLEEWFDARVRNTLEPVLGRTGTRVVIAGGAAALAAGAWWADRQLHADVYPEPEELDETPVPLPGNVTAILEKMIEAAPELGAEALKTQLASAGTFTWALDPEHSDPTYLPLIANDDAPRATPWNFTHPVYARFTADTDEGPQDIYITLEIGDGQLRSTGMLSDDDVQGIPGSPSPYVADTGLGLSDADDEIIEDTLFGGIDRSEVSWPDPADITLVRQTADGVEEI